MVFQIQTVSVEIHLEGAYTSDSEELAEWDVQTESGDSYGESFEYKSDQNSLLQLVCMDLEIEETHDLGGVFHLEIDSVMAAIRIFNPFQKLILTKSPSWCPGK